MFSKFLSLDPEKRDRIINAATKVFAQKGYRNASTNEIVKEADISKGLLFHYFNNKKDMYLFLYDHLMEVFSEKISEKLDWSERDIFIKLRQITLIKFELFDVYPEILNFFKAAYMEEAEEVKGELERRNKEMLSKSYKKFFSDIDTSQFKEGIDIKRAVDIIYWTIEGFGNQQQDQVISANLGQIDIDKIMAEMDVYLELLRRALYIDK
ncbi:TetR/AcrR family transcriptional regulator [Bacillus sp. ISL-47]|uniref:TetR/AcrR family transcriptional regulator n=1 Tax=Bacillus sp. ISL-47 TaxID=2819130 RepID=UPI001BE96134|nr:TetR/AcrR family transcriptional regulator [Bacillus sp. ISL-47]MBT2688230.1 TetR/AcrR family transcriptional regulator [Bacillus sp. ISL-47]MBT2710023.1 TetR/AcrR family transcriptional regulator [Pseudomonas sp. ISL-84]